MNALICPLSLFQRLVNAFTEDPRRNVFVQVGVHHLAADRRWLARDLQFSPPQTSRDRAFRVTLRSDRSATVMPFSWEDDSPAIVGQLVLGAESQRGALWGQVVTESGVEPLQVLSLIGAGMHTLSLDATHESSLLVRPYTTDVSAPLRRWSRTIGALGSEEVWRRLVRLRVAVIGCGRSGSITALSLGRLGLQHLTLIDPDVVELHNLGEMAAVTAADVGDRKALALAAHLRRERAAGGEAEGAHASMTLHPIPAAVTSESALTALKRSEVVFCCVDNDAARLATALVATLYHKVLIDVATGVHFPATPEPQRPGATPRPRHMGADVRMILPGSGCLLCIGNLSRYHRAIEDLCRGVPLTAAPSHWHQHRAGSLQTLNQLAASMGIQMLLDLVAERIHASRWAQLEFDNEGRLAVQYPSTQQPSDSSTCRLCHKAGGGDDGLRL